MNESLRILKKYKACNDALIRYKNTPELHEYDLSKQYSEISTSDFNLFWDVDWLIYNKILKCGRLIYRDFIDYFKEYTYDHKGNMLLSKDSHGNLDEYSYNNKGNIILCKGSHDYLVEYIYDDNGNRILDKNSNGYSVEYLYDAKGNLLLSKDSYDNSFEYTYDNNCNMLSYRDSKGSLVEFIYDEHGIRITKDYEALKYNLTEFRIK